MQNTGLINNSRIFWPTEIPMPFLSFCDNLFHDAYIIFQKKKKRKERKIVDDFEVVYKTCSILVWGAVPR